MATWQDVIPTTRKIKPRILLCSFGLAADAGHSLLLTLRRECPLTRVILLIDHTLHEDRLMPALINGAVGFLPRRALRFQLPSAVRGADRGEAWVPRKMLGTILAHYLR
jgi:DNA-binding NarL/FixJ family response regulator